MAEATKKDNCVENNFLRWIYQPRLIYFSHNCAKETNKSNRIESNHLACDLYGIGNGIVLLKN